jgi:predicted nucleotidyltransferase
MKKNETDRSVLLGAAKWLVDAVVNCHEIKKVALCGSICTNKEHPKDLDVLIYLKSDADIKPVAALKRKLQGQISRGRLGADVFLIEDDKYIGRACYYKEPWCRVVCSNAGLRCDLKRLHLCDTSRTVTLKQELVDNPPVTIFPEFSTIVQLPQDLKEIFSTDLH